MMAKPAATNLRIPPSRPIAAAAVRVIWKKIFSATRFARMPEVIHENHHIRKKGGGPEDCGQSVVRIDPVCQDSAGLSSISLFCQSSLIARKGTKRLTNGIKKLLMAHPGEYLISAGA